MHRSPTRLITVVRTLVVAALLALPMLAGSARAAGTLAGTDITNTADVSYEVGGTPVTQSSNTVTISVDEILDVSVVVQSPQVVVSSPASNVALLFTVTNTGNGAETFSLVVVNSDAGDNFDPLAATPGIYFDSDASGDLSVADVAYVAGNNDPLLAPDASVSVLVVNDIPPNLNNGDVGRSSLVAEALTGSGVPGTVFAGAGTNGVDAVAGSSGALATDTGEYLVSDVSVSIVKSALVSDPFGGSEPVPGATIRYTIVVEVTGSGTAIGLDVVDPIPANTTYTANSLSLNGIALSDAIDTDAGSFDATSGSESVNVQIGDLDAAGGAQTVEFAVLID